MDAVRIVERDVPRRRVPRAHLAILFGVALALPLSSGVRTAERNAPAVERSALSAAVTEAYQELRRDRSAAARDRAFSGWAAH